MKKNRAPQWGHTKGCDDDYDDESELCTLGCSLNIFIYCLHFPAIREGSRAYLLAYFY